MSFMNCYWHEERSGGIKMKKLLISLFAWLMLSPVQSAFASMGALPDEVMAKDADLIVVGRITDINSVKKPVLSKEIDSVIVSTARIIPESMIKGEAHGAPIIIEFSGGRVGDEISVIEDSPSFMADEEVILFLKQIAGTSAYSIVGMSQGKFRIKEGVVSRRNITVDQFIKELKAVIREK